MSGQVKPSDFFTADGTLNAAASSLSREEFAALAQQLAQDIARRDAAPASHQREMTYPSASSAHDDSPTLRVLQQRLRPFDGRRDVRILDAYIDSLENYFTVASMLTEASKIAIAVSYLENTAATWWKSHIRSTRENSNGTPHTQRITTWTSMKKGLLAEFYPTDVIRAARDRLASLRQTGSVKDYADRFRNIELQIPDLSESEKVDRFRRGLKDDVRLQVTLPPALREADFATLLATAIEVDDILFRSQREKRSAYRSSNPVKAEHHRRDTDPMRMDIDVTDLQHTVNVSPIQPKRSPLSVEQRNHLIAKKGCFYCRKEFAGHFIKDCPSRLADEARKPASSVHAAGKDQAQ